jgi:hypothetical protein
MEQRFVPLNAVIGMYSTTTTSWPRPFYDAGYRLEALEFPIKFDGGGNIVADAIGYKAAENRFALHESKSGTAIRDGQARGYAAADPAYLVRSLSVTVGTGGGPTLQSNFVCLEEHSESILWQLEEARANFPVLLIGEHSITAAGAPFEDPALADVFAAPIPILQPPPGIVVVDTESSDADFDQMVYPSLVAAASMQEETVTVAKLAEDSLAHYAIYPAPYRKQLRNKVAAAAERAAAADSQHWAFRRVQGANEDGIIRILSTPEQADPRGRTQQYQAMSGRLQSGLRRRQRAEIPGQGSLFAARSDIEEELERAGSVEADGGEEEP